MTQVPPPGVKNQDTARSILRIAGGIAAFVGLILVVIAFASLTVLLLLGARLAGFLK